MQTRLHLQAALNTRPWHIKLSFAKQKSHALNGNDDELSGIIALAKVQATKTLEFCAREASQILGGKSYLRRGAGANIERIYREVGVAAIGGGSEEVMLDLACRQAKL